MDANQVAFSRANLRAICSVLDSSKPKDQSQRRYIGEKGIGFKSVFQVASTVWISSGFYSFRFDKDPPGGATRPIWTDFPGKKKDGYTSIILQLSDQSLASTLPLINTLKSIDPMVLLFLNRVKRLTITSTRLKDPSNARSQESRARYDILRWQANLAADKLPAKPRVLEPLTISRNSIPKTYLVFRYPIANLPQHEKRNGCESELVLAIPEGFSIENSDQTMTAFSFLPIRDFGFKVCPEPLQ